MFSIQWAYTFSKRAGMIVVRPSRTAASARSASRPVRMNHWTDRRGSTTVPQRSQWPTTIWCGCSASRSPMLGQPLDDARARLEAIQAGELARLAR